MSVTAARTGRQTGKMLLRGAGDWTLLAGGWEHNDQGDFKNRVDDSLVKAPSPGQPAKPSDSK